MILYKTTAFMAAGVLRSEEQDAPQQISQRFGPYVTGRES